MLDLRERLERTSMLAQEKRRKVKQKRYYDKGTRSRTFKVGDKVMLLLSMSSNKLLVKWKGTYEIIGVVNRMDYRINVDGMCWTYHANILKKYIDVKTIRRIFYLMRLAKTPN